MQSSYTACGYPCRRPQTRGSSWQRTCLVQQLGELAGPAAMAPLLDSVQCVCVCVHVRVCVCMCVYVCVCMCVYVICSCSSVIACAVIGSLYLTCFAVIRDSASDTRFTRAQCSSLRELYCLGIATLDWREFARTSRQTSRQQARHPSQQKEGHVWNSLETQRAMHELLAKCCYGTFSWFKWQGGLHLSLVDCYLLTVQTSTKNCTAS